MLYEIGQVERRKLGLQRIILKANEDRQDKQEEKKKAEEQNQTPPELQVGGKPYEVPVEISA